MSVALESKTLSRYKTQWETYERFCKGLPEDPSLPLSVVMFIKSMCDKDMAFSTIRGHVSAIAYHFKFKTTHPTDDPTVAAALKAAGKLAPAVRHRKPLTKSHLVKMAAKVNRLKPV